MTIQAVSSDTGERIPATISAGQISAKLDIIERAMRFDLTVVVARYASDHNVEASVAEETERELRRFLALSAISDEPLGMRGPVDKLWHTFLLFTRPYAKFCSDVAGAYIHHTPTDPKNGSDTAAYQRFLDLYEVAYGEPAPSHIWPQPVRKRGEMYALDECDSNVEDCFGCQGDEGNC